jgi:FkbM family methyltransferase
MSGIIQKMNSKIFTEYMNLVRSKKSFSQSGEDIIVSQIFKLREIVHPSYLDIGANDPFLINNSARLYKKGSRGINIEANPTLFHRFEKYRPLDINLNVGIGNAEAEMDFYIMNDDTLSTFSKAVAESLHKSGNPIKEKRSVHLTTISKVLSKYANNIFPDFLSLDVEGLDLQILKSIDYTDSWPKVICVEIAEYSSSGVGRRNNEIADFLTSKGYYEYANTNLNAIMVKEEFWFK